MSGAARVAAFALLLAGVFAGAAVAGGAIDPQGAGPPPAGDGMGHGDMAAADPVRGLAVAEAGYEVVS